MYRIKLTSRAKKELKNLSQNHKQSLGVIFEEIKEEPYLGKPLSRELTSHFSYRASIYRIIYKINDKDKLVLILTAGHRSTIYN